MQAPEAPETGPAIESKAVVFVDLLGFASLTEEHALQPEQMRISERPLSFESLNLVLSRTENPLTHTFASFHQSLRSVLYFVQMRYPITAVTFSDSAFVATTQLYHAAHIAVQLQQSFLRDRVPVRMGIAYGSFLALRFRSDVTVDGGDHASHFLGTGVVRSYAAERCGIKGLRILVHPSAMLQLSAITKDASRSEDTPTSTTKNSILITNCSEREAENGAGVQHEVNYWTFSPSAEATAWHALQDMWAKAPEQERNHYESTAAAIDRMRIQHGHEPLANLRRRTLPRRRRAAV